jgi:ketosteroid isomerase-like protein
MADNSQQAQSMFQAWEDRDFDSFAQSLADNVRITTVPGGQEISGKQQVLDWYKSWADAFSDATAGGRVTVAGNNGVTMEGLFEGTNDGVFAGSFKPTNQRVSLPWTNVLHFTGAKVSEVAAYFDSLTLMVQLGHMQPPQP